MQYHLKIGEQDFAVEVEAQQAASLRVSVNGIPYDVTLVQDALAPRPRVAAAAPVQRAGTGRIRAGGDCRPRRGPCPHSGPDFGDQGAGRRSGSWPVRPWP